MLPFERFTESAQEIPQRAAEIMQRYGHTQMDTAHILLALIQQPEGVAARLLEMLAVDANTLTERLDAILQAASSRSGISGKPGQIPITPRVKRILELANAETNRMKDGKISTEHLLLGIASERSTPVARLLQGEGVSRDQINDSIRQMRGGVTPLD